MIDTNFDTQEQPKKDLVKFLRCQRYGKDYDYNSKKKAKPRSNATELRQTAIDLFRIAGRPSIQSERRDRRSCSYLMLLMKPTTHNKRDKKETYK